MTQRWYITLGRSGMDPLGIETEQHPADEARTQNLPLLFAIPIPPGEPPAPKLPGDWELHEDEEVAHDGYVAFASDGDRVVCVHEDGRFKAEDAPSVVVAAVLERARYLAPDLFETERAKEPTTDPVSLDDLPELVTVAELAALSRLTPKSVRNAVYENRHIGKHVRRVGGRLLWPRETVVAFIEGRLEVDKSD